jgi:PAS domain S-box-containing protein
MYPPDTPEVFQYFVEHHPLAVAMLDRQMRHLLASRQWLKDCHLSADSLLGHSLYDVLSTTLDSAQPSAQKNTGVSQTSHRLSSSSIEQWKEKCHVCLLGLRDRWEWEEQLSSPRDNKPIWVKWEIWPWKTQAGEIGGLIVMRSDITSFKQTETALKQVNEELELRVQACAKDLGHTTLALQAERVQRQRVEEVHKVLQFSINRAADAVFWVTPAAQFFYVNDAACLSLGYSREELLELSIHDINPDFPPDVWSDYWDEIKQLGAIRLESRHRPKENQIFPVEITINYFRVNGREYNCIFARDITERKQAETELYEAKAAAEAANKARSAFLANMSHELRTPLTAIIGYSELLKEDAIDLGLGETDFISDLQSINTSGKQLLSVLSEILDFSKIESGQMELDLNAFDIAALIREVQKNIEPLLEPNSNQLSVICPDNIGTMYADWIKVRQILLNLLGNATKFTEHGVILLEVSRQETPDFQLLRSGTNPIKSSSNNLETWIVFRVTDTGIGMTKDQLPTIFEAFTQVDASSTRRYGGTGMGLAISRSFCQMMGGEIVVESQLGEGSTFVVYLPAAVPNPEEE